MAVAHDAVSESHTGTTGSTSQASFSWSHNPVGTPAGVVVFTFTVANADDATSVTYDSVDMARVGRAADSAGEPLDCVAWFLGSVPTTDPATVVVNRNNNSNVMYAACVTVTAAAPVSVIGPAVTVSGDGTLAEQAVDSGSFTALRYAAVNSRLNAVPAAGSNSTSLISIDFGNNVAAVVRETTGGSGSRSVGFTDAGSDDRASVHLALAEAGPVHDRSTASALFTTTTPFTFDHTPAGTPKAVVVSITAADDVDTITGVTYGGVSMTREGFTSGSGEDGAAWVYFLGSGISTGTQTVSITHGGTAVEKWAVCSTYLSSASTTDVVDFEVITNGSLDDPRVTLDSSTTYGSRIWVADTGHGAHTSITAPSGSHKVAGQVYTGAAKAAAVGRESILTVGNTSVGWDYGPGADDTHLVGVVIVDVTASAATVTPEAIARSISVLASTQAGKAEADVSTIARSVIMDAVTVRGGAVAGVSAIALAAALGAVTIDNGAADATVTPATTALAAAINSTVLVGGGVVSLGANNYAIVLPQSLPRSPATQSPSALATVVTLPLATVRGGSVVTSGMSVNVVLPPSVQISTGSFAVGTIELTVVNGQPTIIIGDTPTGDKYLDRVWS